MSENEPSQSSIDQLYLEYVKARSLDIDRKHFLYILNLLPAFWVVLSDGIMDQDEWGIVKKLGTILGKNVVKSEEEDELLGLYKNEFRYLIRHQKEWKDKFFNALRSYFDENPSAKDFVVETMFLFAGASEGI